jgi:cell division protein FtsW
MTCIALGIILSVTKKEEEIAQEEADKQRREEALQRLIDKQLLEEAEAERAGAQGQNEDDNPMNAVLNR